MVAVLLKFLRGLDLRDAYWSRPIGHLIVTLPFIMRALLASLAAFDFSLVDAARTLGLAHAAVAGGFVWPTAI